MHSIEESRHYTVVYNQGVAIDVLPAPECTDYDIRDYAYYATLLLVNGIKIDLLSYGDLELIDTKINIEVSSSSVGRLDNDLRFQAYNIREAGYHEQSIRILKTAQTIMERYPTWWKPDSFFGLAEWLYEDGRDEEAEMECKHIRFIIENYSVSMQKWDGDVRNSIWSRYDDTDFWVLDYQHTCCGECAKYRGRIYSASGNDKRFPVLPDVVRTTGHIHDGCTCFFIPAYTISVMAEDKDSKPITLYDEDAIRYSNRPFIDDRTEEEKARYAEWKKRQNKKEQDQQYVDFENRIRKSGKNKRMYNFVKEYLPDLAPKSYSAYMRAKNQKTKKYLLIEERMKEKGIDIEVR